MSGIYVGTSSGMKELKIGKEEVHGEQIFTESGTFTVPEGVTKIDVFLVGGGASGGYGWSTGGIVGVFCGGGGFTRTITQLPVSPGDTHTIIIGKGGTASSSGTIWNNNYGNKSICGDGGDTYFDGYLCRGGKGANNKDDNGSLNTGIITGGIAAYSGTHDYTKGTMNSWTQVGFSQDDSTNAFGLLTETKYCEHLSNIAGSGGKGWGYRDYGYADKGKDGICIIRW